MFSMSAEHDVTELLALCTSEKSNGSYQLQQTLRCPSIFGHVVEVRRNDEMTCSFASLYPDEESPPRIFALYEAGSVVPVVPCILLAVSHKTHRFLSLSSTNRALCGILHDASSVRKTSSRAMGPVLDAFWGERKWLPIWDMFRVVMMKGKPYLRLPTPYGMRSVPVEKAKALFESNAFWSHVEGSDRLVRVNPVVAYFSSGRVKRFGVSAG